MCVLTLLFPPTAKPRYQIFHDPTNTTITVKPDASGVYIFRFDGKKCAVPLTAKVGKQFDTQGMSFDFVAMLYQ